MKNDHIEQKKSYCSPRVEVVCVKTGGLMDGSIPVAEDGTKEAGMDKGNDAKEWSGEMIWGE
jgi:hypothetical protein